MLNLDRQVTYERKHVITFPTKTEADICNVKMFTLQSSYLKSFVHQILAVPLLSHMYE